MTTEMTAIPARFTDHSVLSILSTKPGCRSQPAMTSRRRTRRNPTRFTDVQRERLEREFQTDKYPDVNTRERLADEIGVAESKIQVWFSNRRSRLRRALSCRPKDSPVVTAVHSSVHVEPLTSDPLPPSSPTMYGYPMTSYRYMCMGYSPLDHFMGYSPLDHWAPYWQDMTTHPNVRHEHWTTGDSPLDLSTQTFTGLKEEEVRQADMTSPSVTELMW